MVIDSEDAHLKAELAHRFSGELIRFYIGTDIIGNEIGAAAKNVIGIAAGILDGMSQESLKGALMSRGTREISRLIKSSGGNELTAYGLSHLGDYQATLFSQHSHNRIFGENFVLGKSFNKLAEGVYTTKALISLGKKHNIDLPICNAVNSIIHCNENPQSTVEKLFMRSLKDEF
jgi:glycerol-3-phosphate dehydrogenase (NAD(P)+)